MTLVDSDGQAMLPWLDSDGNVHDSNPFWASLAGMTGAVRLDCNYIYDPVPRESLTGGIWRALRKSMARVERELHSPLILRPIVAADYPRIEQLALDWAGDSEIYDPEVMMGYLLNGPHWGVCTCFSTRLLGVVAWDTNFKFVNFRYCVVDGTGPVGLDEYTRWLFWDWVKKTFPTGAQINDGGGLDREGLHHYKQKLNPTLKFNIWSKL